MNSLEDIRRIAVIGAGTMGSGIAQLCAAAGYETLLFDLNAQALEAGMGHIRSNLDGAIQRGKMTEEQKGDILSRVRHTDYFRELKADFFIEAVVERLEVKRELFGKLAAQNAPEAILSTNTSSIPITQIAYSTPNPERVVGMHFFNPAHIMKLVEVISGAATAPQVAEITRQLAVKLGKTAVMAADAPGFIVNRVARHFYVEGLKILEENVAGVEDIDGIMEATGFKMGPFRLMDLIGVDTNFDVTTSIYNQFQQDGKFRPNRIQKQKVDAGFHGRKSGKGFYTYQ